MSEQSALSSPTKTKDYVETRLTELNEAVLRALFAGDSLNSSFHRPAIVYCPPATEGQTGYYGGYFRGSYCTITTQNELLRDVVKAKPSKIMVRLGRFERPTSGSGDQRSIH